MDISTNFTRSVGIRFPLICGAMYPCSNPELVAAVSNAGGIGIVQPLSLVYVYRYDLRAGLRAIKALTDKPFGMNVLIEKSSQKYEARMMDYVDVALDEGVRFFISALGKPDWVVRKVHARGGIVYHDVTERKWALKAKDCGVDGFICVNKRAGGHAGGKAPGELYDELRDLGLPLVCAGGIGDERGFVDAIRMGFSAVQMGTRFIATTQCAAPAEYKQAILDASSDDIVHTERVTGVPLAVIKTPYVERAGYKVGPLARMLFRNARTRHWMRVLYNVRSAWSMKRAMLKGFSTKDYFAAGMSVDSIESIEDAAEIVTRFGEALENSS